MFKKLRKNEKGFTLAELLIVVAIIGVLVAISIPIFTSQLEKAREATDLANIRAAYAEASVKALEGDNATAQTYTATTVKAQSTGTWVTDISDITWGTLPTTVDNTKTFTVTIDVAADGTSTTTVSQP